ncbi:MAG TPA: glycoside hydrolase domain-containing protein, partial [Phycisphaerae bacterium]|nr:glycoside hydrolase domain-containing protein [Phycisphaerae bacterium]
RHFFLRYWNGETDGRARGGAPSRFLGQISLRGRFRVTDPAKVQGLKLTLEYRGGAAVYVNGTPLARGHLPAGALAGGAPAEAYPEEATFKEPGKAWSWYGDRNVFAEKLEPLRVRRLAEVAVPNELLRPGINVLAIEIHSAPYPAGFAAERTRPNWSPCGLIDVQLAATGGEGIEPNVTRPAGVQVWTTNSLEPVHDIDWFDPLQMPGPLRLTCPRNGSCTARAVVSSDKPLKGLSATMGGLAGADGARIPASAVRVSYGVFEPRGGNYANIYGLLHDDGMNDAPPEVVPVSGTEVPAPFVPGAVQPVYVTVRVPAGAAPGLYKGSLALRIEGGLLPAVPVELAVAGWTVPDPKDFTYWCGLIQSPEGVAGHYAVPLWSDRHWELMGTSFDWIAQLGPRVLYIPATAQTEFGNAEGMVRFVRGADGELKADLSVVERYVDLAVKRMGPVRYVLLGVWQWCEERKADEQGGPLITVLDPADGTTQAVRGPKHGSEQAAALWGPVLEGVRKILDRHGLGGAMVLGNGDDQLPNAETVEMFRRILPQAGWYANRHKSDASLVHPKLTVPIAYQSNVYGSGDVPDPAARRLLGWRSAYPVDGGVQLWLERKIYDSHCLTLVRRIPESMLMSGRSGQGQIGADFWPPSGKTNRLGTLFSRYPRTANVGAGGTGLTTTRLLFPGRNGALPTLRFETMREGIQETEARIFLERLLAAQPCPLPGELAARAQAVLDERARWSRLADGLFDVEWAWPYSGWQQRTDRLYQAAAEAAKAVKGKP